MPTDTTFPLPPAVTDAPNRRPPAARGRTPTGGAGRWVGLLAYLGLLALAGRHTLIPLATLAADSAFHSHILLVPLITAYLLYLRRGKLPGGRRPSPGWAAGFLVVGGAAWLLAAGAWHPAGGAFSPESMLPARVGALVSFLVAGGFLFLGSKWMAAAAFPVAFLGFLVPLPDGLVIALESASKLASAEVAGSLFELVGTPVLRDGPVFELPGIVIEVAQECSGVRSSFALFLTALLAGQLLLGNPWRRALLVLLVFPLGILRNGFRIFVLGFLCVRFGPQMIDSVIHHRGGPIFFALSLVPLFLLLWWLRRGDASPVASLDTPRTPGPGRAAGAVRVTR